MTEVGLLIKAYRETKKFSQSRLAKKLGFTNQFLGRIELGKAPLPLVKAKKILKTLNIDPLYFESVLLRDYSNKIYPYIFSKK